MMTQRHHGHFVPLTWVTLGFDYVVLGLNPAGYHLTSLVKSAPAPASLPGGTRAGSPLRP
jgi:hypothetical protein